MSELNKAVKVTESSTNGTDSPKVTAGESYRSMGEILSSMDPGPPLPGPELNGEKPTNKFSGSGVKRSTFWSRSAVSSAFLPSFSFPLCTLVPNRAEILRNVSIR